jgi:hypothetical protein
MTGERELRGSALLEYFQPLFEFLQKENGMKVNARSENSDGTDQTMDQSTDQTIPIVVGGVILGIVIAVIVGYIVFRRRAAKKNETA